MMLKKHMAACLVATLFAAPAFAQTTGAPSGASTRPMTTGSGSTAAGSPAMQPGMANTPAGSDTNASGPALNSTAAPSSSMNSASSNAQSSSTTAQAGANNGQFMTQMQPNQMMASDLIGTKVVSANNESVGDINDVVVDRSGQAVAAVVGVGGFLGIGEKNVAVPFNSLQFASRAQVNAMNNAANNANANANNGAMSNSGNNVAAAGSTAMNNNVNATGSTNTAGGASASAAGNQPERVILNMTKAELQAAPKFNKNGNNTATGTASPNQ